MKCAVIVSCMELERGELDSVILGRLSACVMPGKITSRGKERQRDRYRYTFKIFARVFRYVHAVGLKLRSGLANLQSHYQAKSIEPRVHGNKGRRRHNALMFEQVEHVVHFLERHSESYGLSGSTSSTSRSSRHASNLPSNFSQQKRSFCALQGSL